VALDATGGYGYQHAMLAQGATRGSIQLDHSSRDAMIERFFNTDAFVPVGNVPLGTYGNAGRGLISGPALNTSDFALLKDFMIREPVRVQFRSEFFNAFNQVNFNNPDQAVVDLGDTFGRITSAQPGRVIQFALKILW
jgi:hypothetical protein